MCSAGGSSHNVLRVLVITDCELTTQINCASRVQARMCQCSAYVACPWRWAEWKINGELERLPGFIFSVTFRVKQPTLNKECVVRGRD